ncbi:hypothetical protein [Halalkalibacter flavus]|uniref:hypothetical protein n=1 Tax=Halalkalibacter flavus TaxID=3090668 RepID=UPI002FCAEE0A
MSLLADFIAPAIGVLVGSGVTVWLFKKSEERKNAEERLKNLNSLLRLTDKLCFSASEILFRFDIKNDDDRESVRLFHNELLYEYERESLFYAIYIDEETYNETVKFIDKLGSYSTEIREYNNNPEEYSEKIKLFFKVVPKEGQTLISFCNQKRSDYFNDFANKYIKK